MRHYDWPLLLKDFRARYCLTQQECADQFGCAPQTWHLWETGKRRPGAHRRRLEIFVRTPPDFLPDLFVAGTDEPPTAPME